MKNSDIYEKVTEKIIQALEQGVVPWKRPWRSVGNDVHRNLVSKKAYRGVNVFLCEMSAAINGFSSPYWLSKKQIIDKKGTWSGPGTLIVFWKIMRKQEEVDGEIVTKTIPLLRYYYVWNVDQCEGIKVPEAEELPEFDPIEEAQMVIDNMPQRPETFHRGDRAFYRPGNDTVTLPVPEAFDSPEAYYNTAYHEYVHSTGHQSRTGRVKDWTSFGSDPYANEELVAEMGAAMLCGSVGIDVTHEQSAAYIATWISRFKNDTKLLVSAAGQAQKAADWVRGESFTMPEAEKELASA